MKKKLSMLLALAMALSLLAGCAASAAALHQPGPTPSATDEPSEEPVDLDAVEARIEAMGAAYDGLTYYDDYFTDRGLTNSVMSSVPIESFEALAGAAAPMEGAFAMEEPLSTDGWSGYDAPWVEFNTEGYNAVEESGFVLVGSQPFSTFGADVDTATYANLRRSIFSGGGIAMSAIRVEEMMNYFHYDYGTPEDGEKFWVGTELTGCPWNKDALLLRIGVRAEEIDPSAGSNIVFLIDTSGSMFDGNKLPLAQRAFGILTEQLTENDRVSIVTYAGGDEVILEGVSGSRKAEIKNAVDGLEAWGSTNGEGGIRRAYELAERYFIEGGNNRVILATDGDLNVGITSEADLIDLIEEEKQSGVFLSCLGFGEGNYMDDKMEALADHGNGNYAYIDCTAEARKVLEEELWSTLYTVAKDVKFQVEFNPDQVAAYRLIGYENRSMAAEDFADDAKDGGEVGSGQTVTVLYELIPAGSDFALPEVASRYGNGAVAEVPSDFAGELLAVNVRYKEPDGDKSVLRTYPVSADDIAQSMSDDTSWAAGVAQFGMLLRGSEYAGQSSYQEIYDRLKRLPSVMEDDYRAEFLYLVKRAMSEDGPYIYNIYD